MRVFLRNNEVLGSHKAIRSLTRSDKCVAVSVSWSGGCFVLLVLCFLSDRLPAPCLAASPDNWLLLLLF